MKSSPSLKCSAQFCEDCHLLEKKEEKDER